MTLINAARNSGVDGTVRLLWVVVSGVLFIAVLMLRSGAGSWPNRVWGALLAAFLPLLFAWPALATTIRLPAWRVSRARPGSCAELERLRRAGAI